MAELADLLTAASPDALPAASGSLAPTDVVLALEGATLVRATTAQAGAITSAERTKLSGIEALADVTDAGNVAAAGAVMDGDFAGATVGAMRRTGAGAYAVLMDNLVATAAPTANDDSGDGYAVGSLWCDVTNDNVYVCIDATATAAIWRGIMPRRPRDRSTNVDITISGETDEIIRVDSSGGNRQLTLPDPALRWAGLIKKTSTGTNTTTLVRHGSEQIEGASANYTLPGSSNTDRPSWTVWSDGTNYWVA